MTVRGKRAHITSGGEAIIIARSLEYPRLQRTKLAAKLQDEFEAAGYDIPQMEVLERKISKYRNQAEAGQQENPWSMATLDDYPIPPEAIPAVLDVWKFRVAREEGFTIREAKWASRYSVLVTDMEDLSFIANLYAHTELMSVFIHRPFDSTVLDKLLMDLVARKVRVTPDGKGFTRITGQDIRKEYAHISREKSESEYIKARKELGGHKNGGTS